MKSGALAGRQIVSYIVGHVPANDVVDLQLIGHSRGSVVITEAMKTIQNRLPQIPQAKGGFWELTYLNAHPAHGDNEAPFSSYYPKLIDAANALQEIYKDPKTLTVPSHVALAQVYYQNTTYSDITYLTAEDQINPWGLSQGPNGIKGTPGASTQFEVMPLTTPGMTHTGVWEWYIANVVPTLGTANPFVTTPKDAPIVANGETLSVTVGQHIINPKDYFAYFYDNNPNSSLSQYTATIDFGDGTGIWSYNAVAGVPTPAISFTPTPSTPIPTSERTTIPSPSNTRADRRPRRPVR